MSFPYTKVLVIGATSGIGKALATKLVQNGTQVIIAGRRKENLDEFVKENGSEKVKYKVFDVMNLEAVSARTHLSCPQPEFMKSSTNPSQRFPSLHQKWFPRTLTLAVSSSTPESSGRSISQTPRASIWTFLTKS